MPIQRFANGESLRDQQRRERVQVFSGDTVIHKLPQLVHRLVNNAAPVIPRESPLTHRLFPRLSYRRI